jgi:hypothetical protein
MTQEQLDNLSQLWRDYNRVREMWLSYSKLDSSKYTDCGRLYDLVARLWSQLVDTRGGCDHKYPSGTWLPTITLELSGLTVCSACRCPV